ncbi:MAG: nickel pincer cofactor biosynthesis protein LarC [Clostridium sp.]|nr:nickel pincer cofactor biosynthesis protein LarC [Acetatifactor muris]MCM1528193.1 nickel pincer cofactor biosynthesis protein LarC [Bacteroides sp.]MCM1564266.1 nickel pincer cofactor biosynthesis protein LarC [Clostridium sp.]
MKTLYLDCSMGAAGDMLMAALLELIPDPDGFVEEMNALGIPGVCVRRETAVKCGITGTHISVTVNGEEEESLDVHTHHHDHGHAHEDAHDQGHAHHHSSLHDIEHIVREHLHLPKEVQEDVMAVYTLIAEAESRAHGRSVSEIHFHEVGAMDAIADIVAVCWLMHRLVPDEVVVSPIHVGSGQVRCAHGILPVPAPATAHILQGVPIYGGSIAGELCTPTGAALLKRFATRFGEMPVMRTTAIGYGMGKKDFEAANCIRALWGETDAPRRESDVPGSGLETRESGRSGETDEMICELSCNVDDMTAEAVGFAVEQLFRDGALDVYTVPIGMKKSRPGILIHVMCRAADKDKILRSIFKHTTTIGIRESRPERYVLERRMETLDTPYGPVRCKISSGYGVERVKYEYEDLARIARERNESIAAAEVLVRHSANGQ